MKKFWKILQPWLALQQCYKFTLLNHQTFILNCHSIIKKCAALIDKFLLGMLFYINFLFTSCSQGQVAGFVLRKGFIFSFH